MARGISRGMLLARASYLGLGVIAACLLAVPAWMIGHRGAPTGRAAVVQAARPEPAAPSPKVDRHGDPLPDGAAMRLGTVRYRQGSPIYRIAYAADGKHLVTDGDDGKLRVWDAASGQVVRLIDPEAGVPSDFGLTSDGKTVMTAGLTFERGGGIFRNITSTEIATGRVVSRFNLARAGTARQPALCPDRQILAVGSTLSKTTVIRDARIGVESARVAEAGRPNRLAFSPDGRRLAVEISPDGLTLAGTRVIVWDVEQKKELRTIPETQLGNGALAFSPDGTLLAVPTTMEVGVWEVATGKRIRLDWAFLQYVPLLTKLPLIFIHIYILQY